MHRIPLAALLIVASSRASADELLQRWRGSCEQMVSLYWHTTVYRPRFLQFRQRLPITTYRLIYHHGKTTRTIWWRQQIEAPSTPDWGPAEFQCDWKDDKTVGLSFMYAGMYLFFSECDTRKPAPKIPRPADQPAEQGRAYLINGGIHHQQPTMSSFHLLHHLRLPSYATLRKPGSYWCTLKEMTWQKERKTWQFVIKVEKVLTFEDLVANGKTPDSFLVRVTTTDGKRWQLRADSPLR